MDHKTQTDIQRKHIDHLMRNIDQEMELLTGPKQTVLKPPPEIVLNVRGSSAGAGSSEFHTYQQLRRKENLRIKLIETEAAEDAAKQQYTEELDVLKQKDAERTAKNRAKRQKRQGNKKSKKKVAGGRVDK